eukprot:gnl/TRDRNA2_/TRDRNA2_175494_c2_seq22.p2 gnl/TRDRNA2_/TRDRNA2_175494_c2~~gnl/TRDRNA2_/TRDRNA2_175494_c2_seq22.p2  ORF type:complete len:178 (-),score=25.10 gnl/TRDRNA2_/TRDRNA2_175494_c2_seq22:369-902(-)
MCLSSAMTPGPRDRLLEFCWMKDPRLQAVPARGELKTAMPAAASVADLRAALHESWALDRSGRAIQEAGTDAAARRHWNMATIANQAAFDGSCGAECNISEGAAGSSVAAALSLYSLTVASCWATLAVSCEFGLGVFAASVAQMLAAAARPSAASFPYRRLTFEASCGTGVEVQHVP